MWYYSFNGLLISGWIATVKGEIVKAKIKNFQWPSHLGTDCNKPGPYHPQPS
jgi:hypothetical protein